MLLALLLAPTASAATPLIGIGEQHPQLFTDPSFHELGIRDVRFVAAWDALSSGWQRAEVDAYLQAARTAKVHVLLSFGHSREPKKAHSLPSVKAFEREVIRFRKRYPWVREYITWNGSTTAVSRRATTPSARPSTTGSCASAAAAA